MVIHIRDAEPDGLVRQLAQQRGVSITQAVHDAVSAALASQQSRASLWDRTDDVRERFKSSAL